MKPQAVTIVIPCHNAARWIGAAIESALAQTWPEKEVIVVDDGSTDGSTEIVRGFGERVIFLETEHCGGNHARNAALKMASGEWVQFLDADDYLEPEKIARQLFEEAHGGASADVIYSPTWVEERGQRIVHTIDTALDLFSQWLTWQMPQTGGALWRMSALLQIGGWKELQPCCQEHELYLRALKAGLRFVFTQTPHAVYRIWSQDTVCRRDRRLVVNVKTALIDDLRAWLTERGEWTEEHQRLAGRACFEMARTLAKMDLASSEDYHQARLAKQLIHLEGPAAPRNYRWVYHAAGFTAAERVAKVLRR
jgi:glycosyltransferase involved in cell wall biosynthesis